MKAQLWADTEQEVRKILAAMPDQFRSRFKETAETHFKPLIDHARGIKERFGAEGHIGECHRLAARYLKTYACLTRVVSLHSFGVPLHLCHGQMNTFLGMGKGAAPEQVALSGRREAGLYEETLTQSVRSTA